MAVIIPEEGWRASVFQSLSELLRPGNENRTSLDPNGGRAVLNLRTSHATYGKSVLSWSANLAPAFVTLTSATRPQACAYSAGCPDHLGRLASQPPGLSRSPSQIDNLPGQGRPLPWPNFQTFSAALGQLGMPLFSRKQPIILGLTNENSPFLHSPHLCYRIAKSDHFPACDETDKACFSHCRELTKCTFSRPSGDAEQARA